MRPEKAVCFTCFGKNSIDDEFVDLNKIDLDGIPYIKKLRKCVQGLCVSK